MPTSRNSLAALRAAPGLGRVGGDVLDAELRQGTADLGLVRPRRFLAALRDVEIVAAAVCVEPGRRGEVNAVFGLTANRLPPAARRKMIPLGPRFGRVQWKTCQPFQRARALPPCLITS